MAYPKIMRERVLRYIEGGGSKIEANRAKDGELHLHNSIFGILKKEFGEFKAA